MMRRSVWHVALAHVDLLVGAGGPLLDEQQLVRVLHGQVVVIAQAAALGADRVDHALGGELAQEILAPGRAWRGR